MKASSSSLASGRNLLTGLRHKTARVDPLPETATGTHLLRRYLANAIAAERGFETHLSEFANQGDDLDVQVVFRSQADEMRTNYQRLTARLEQLGGPETGVGSALSELVESAPQMSESGRIQEEQTLQNLIAAFGIEASECAMHEVVASVAAAADDAATESLAREIQAQKREAAKRIFSFLSSRSKIAYNMLTPHELDPAVETKTFQNRVV